MSIESVNHFQPMATEVGKQLLDELLRGRWEVPHYQNLQKWGIALGSHPGMVRRRNEDRSAFGTVSTRFGQRLFLAVVCDGVGGSKEGDAASTLAIASLFEELSNYSSNDNLRDFLAAAIRRMDDVVRLELEGKGSTTASILVISAGGCIAACNVGDSRIFSWSPDERSLLQVSVDDTMENELKKLAVADSGMLDAHGLRGSLSQAIGEPGRKSEDLNLVVFTEENFSKGAVLASDGAWKGNELGFLGIIENSSSALDVSRRTVAFATWVGGADNISIVAISNLQLLADACFAEDRVQSHAQTVRLSVWFADTKFTTSAILPERTIRNESSPSLTGIDPPEISKLKVRTRKRKRKIGLPSEGELDLSKGDSSEIIKKEKRIIEISTDEHSDER